MRTDAPPEDPPEDPEDGRNDDRQDEGDGRPRYVRVHDLRPEDYDGTCLRPLGLCELGGCCDICWYRPDHPRFREQSGKKKQR